MQNARCNDKDTQAEFRNSAQVLCSKENRYNSKNRKHGIVVLRHRELTAAVTEMQLKNGRDLFHVNSLQLTILFTSGIK